MNKFQSIYDKPSQGVFYSPFNIQIGSMEKLILINIGDDPDKYYKEFEIQQVIADNNKKLLVIAYRIDGAIDIYHQPDYPLDSQSSVFAELDVFARSMSDAEFEVTPERLEVYMSFKDRYNRDIELKVIESNRQTKKPFSILAPIGGGSEKPLSLPVYILYEMAFTRKAYTDISVQVDGALYQPSTMPLPVDFARNYLTRYSADTFIVDWNQNYDGYLTALNPDSTNKVENQGIRYELDNNNGHYEIRGMSVENDKHKINIDFSPALPDFLCLKDNISLQGEFIISAHKSIGTIKGVYKIIRKQNKVFLSIVPDKGWIPKEKKLSMKLFYLLAPFFKKWPSTFIWKAEVDFSDAGNPEIKSGWKRVEGYKEKLNSGFFKMDI
ncbi:MAG: hypothetical protein ACOC2J_00755 [bacterium]